MERDAEFVEIGRKVNPAHKKQVLTYLGWTGLKLGYLLNFGAAVMKDGIYCIINGETG